MKNHLAIIAFVAALATLGSMNQLKAQKSNHLIATEATIPAGNTTLYTRAVGKGTPVIVLHGGPDFDHSYLLPELDELAGKKFRLIYYDQRGRGKSAENVRPEDVSLASELDDISRVLNFYRLDRAVLLGHSWGAALALEYALRNPTRVSKLILMNPAPVSTTDLAAVRKKYLERLGPAMDRQREIVKSAEYQSGEPSAVAARYRIHFQPSLKRLDDYEKMMARMKAAFESQGKAGIVKARAVEDRLMGDTWDQPGYDLLRKLRRMRTPTLVIAGDHDFMAGAAESIAAAIPGSISLTARDCGHFAFMECAEQVRRPLEKFGRSKK